MNQSFVIGDVLQGKYEIKSVLGTGGMGTVYRARQIDLGRDVAIKVPNPQALEVPGFLQRFSREARLVAKLVHDNIVQVYEYFEAPDAIYIVMEYVEGQDLKSMITRPPADLTVKDLAIILRSACEGLAHAHEFGIVHRDIKPHNIMVEQRARGKWRVKIMDFGIAHADANANMTMLNNQEQLTVTGQAIGTPSYMSPEQIRGSGVTAKSDVYSMGCVIFYAFTRTTPFQGTGFTVAASHLSDAPPAIRSRSPELPPQVEDVVNLCLEKDPELRPADSSDLGQRLYEALESIYDKRMVDIWPGAEHSGGGTDVLKNTKPLGTAVPGDTSQKTETDQSSKKGSARPADSDRIPGITMGSKTATMAPKFRGPTPADRTQSQTGVTSATGQTIPYQAPPVSAEAVATAEATPAPASKKNILLIAAAFLIPLLIVGIGIGYIVMSRQLKGKKEIGSENGGTVVAGTESGTTTGTAGTNPTPKPTPAPTAAATPTITPSPSPRPTPSPDPLLTRIDSMKEFFAKASTLNDRAQLWQQAATDQQFASDPKMVEVADEFALQIVRSPELRTINAGRFTMGSASNEGEAEERPQNNVSFSAYEVGKFEVTALEFATFLNAVGAEEGQKLYKAIPLSNVQFVEATKRFEPVSGKALHPANAVSWTAAARYCEWLSQLTGKRYRLPTEAEWENAARAGSGFKYPWGDNEPSGRQAQYNAGSEGTVAVLEMTNGRNVWGLAHMAGNVAEWCQDWYSERAYDEGDRDNPKGPATPPEGDRRPRRVVRGGSYQSLYTNDIRNARRDRVEPEKASSDIGFRIVREGGA